MNKDIEYYSNRLKKNLKESEHYEQLERVIFMEILKLKGFKVQTYLITNKNFFVSMYAIGLPENSKYLIWSLTDKMKCQNPIPAWALILNRNINFEFKLRSRYINYEGKEKETLVDKKLDEFIECKKVDFKLKKTLLFNLGLF